MLQDDYLESFDNLKKDLLKATETTLRLAKPGQQYVILCDASYYSSGFVLMFEDYLEQKDGKKKQAYAPVSYGSQLFNASQLKMSTYCKEFPALYFALEYFSHFIWGAEKPVIILTDNRSLTSFFSIKVTSSSIVEFHGQSPCLQYSSCTHSWSSKCRSRFSIANANRSNSKLGATTTRIIPMKEIEIDMKAKTPDAPILAIENDQPEQVEPQPHILSEDIINIINSKRALQNLIPHLNDLLASGSKDTISEGYLIKRAPEIKSIQQNDPLNYFETSTINVKPLNIPEEQKKDPVIRKVMEWIQNGCTDELT